MFLVFVNEDFYPSGFEGIRGCFPTLEQAKECATQWLNGKSYGNDYNYANVLELDSGNNRYRNIFRIIKDDEVKMSDGWVVL